MGLRRKGYRISLYGRRHPFKPKHIVDSTHSQ